MTSNAEIARRYLAILKELGASPDVIAVAERHAAEWSEKERAS